MHFLNRILIIGGIGTGLLLFGCEKSTEARPARGGPR